MPDAEAVYNHLRTIQVTSLVLIPLLVLTAVGLSEESDDPTPASLALSRQGRRSTNVLQVVIFESTTLGLLAATEARRALVAREVERVVPLDLANLAQSPTALAAGFIGALRIHAVLGGINSVVLFGTAMIVAHQDSVALAALLLVATLFAVAQWGASVRLYLRGQATEMRPLTQSQHGRLLVTCGALAALCAHTLLLTIAVPVSMNRPTGFFGLAVFLGVVISVLVSILTWSLLRTLTIVNAAGRFVPPRLARPALLTSTICAALCALCVAGLLVRTILHHGGCDEPLYYPCQSSWLDSLAVLAPLLLQTVAMLAVAAITHTLRTVHLAPSLLEINSLLSEQADPNQADTAASSEIEPEPEPEPEPADHFDLGVEHDGWARDNLETRVRAELARKGVVAAAPDPG